MTFLSPSLFHTHIQQVVLVGLGITHIITCAGSERESESTAAASLSLTHIHSLSLAHTLSLPLLHTPQELLVGLGITHIITCAGLCV